MTAQASNKVIVFDDKIFFNLLMDTLEDVFLDSVSGSCLLYTSDAADE